MRNLRLNSLPLAIFVLLAGIYLLTTGGHTYAIDEEQMLAAAESLATQGSFVIEQGADGPHYSSYGPGQSLLAVPLVLLGHAVAAAFPPDGFALITRDVVSWFNPLVTAISAALIALAALRLGYSRAAATGTALLYGLATLAWPHSKTFFAEPLASLLTFAAFVVVLGPVDEPGGRWRMAGSPALALSGFFAALACTVKLQAGLALPFIGLWVLFEHVARRQATDGGRRSDKRRIWSSVLRPSLLWGLGAIGGLGLLGLYQWAIFGSPLRSGYGGASGVFNGDMVEGLYGLLISPGKGIIWYAPPLLLLPIGLWQIWRRHPSVAALCALLSLATLLLYARVIFWHGDGAWGPRYLNMALPFMALPLVGLFRPCDDVASACQRDKKEIPARGRLSHSPAAPKRGESSARECLSRSLLAITLILTAIVQFAGVTINLNAYLGVQRDSAQRYFVPSQSPIIGHLRLAAAQLATIYNVDLAPGSLALRDGFSYSEGDRSTGAQLPRWSTPQATIVLRPGGARQVRVELSISGCVPAPLQTSSLDLQIDGIASGTFAACPPRRISMLLPGRSATIGLQTTGWDPATIGLERDGPLGIYLSQAGAWADGSPLRLTGDLVPISPAPAGSVSLRQWSSDYRYGHWDFWWWYLAHSGLPVGPVWIFTAVWVALGGLMATSGLIVLRQNLGVSA